MKLLVKFLSWLSSLQSLQYLFSSAHVVQIVTQVLLLFFVFEFSEFSLNCCSIQFRVTIGKSIRHCLNIRKKYFFSYHGNWPQFLHISILKLALITTGLSQLKFRNFPAIRKGRVNTTRTGNQRNKVSCGEGYQRNVPIIGYQFFHA